MSHSPPPLPRHTRSDFDLEPNPFEQSFSARGQPSNVRAIKQPSPASSSSSRSSHSNSKQRSSSPRTVLPPLASISSPADQSHSWPFSNALGSSLRAGPLSPAMLQGPQPNSDPAHLQFDPSSFRSGLTPRSGMTPRTGLTPATGFTPFVGSSAPFPPSPNTAAFLAIMNNSSSAAPSSGVTITPNTLNAISGVLNPAPTQHHYQPSHLQHSHTQSSSSQENDPSYIPSASSAANTAANGLFLLSQAHQELTKREEAQARAGANGPSNGNPAANGISTTTTNGKRTTRRKSYDIPASPPAPQTRGGKRARTDATRARRRSPTEEMGPPDDDDDDDDDEVMAEDVRDSAGSGGGGGRRTSKKPETEEEKRKNFLERNRQAALKCRQRKKAWLASLQAKVEFLTNENERLTSALVSSREEISRLSTLVGSAAVGPDHGSMSVHPGGASGAQPVSMNVSMSSKAPGVAVAAAGGRSGYGY